MMVTVAAAAAALRAVMDAAAAAAAAAAAVAVVREQAVNASISVTLELRAHAVMASTAATPLALRM